MERKLGPDLPIVAVALVLYCINRFTTHLSSLAWAGPFFRFHFNDYLGAIVFACYVNILLAVCRRPKLTRLLPLMALGGLCSLCWEGLAPLVLTYSTGDWLDCAAYLLGCMTYWGLIQTFKRQKGGT